MPGNINPIYTRVGDIQGGILLGTTGLLASDYTGQAVQNIPVFTADASNGGFIQKLRFKAGGGANATAAVARIYIVENALNTTSPCGAPGTPSGTPATTGGTMLGHSGYFAKVQAIDSWGAFSTLSSESASVNITAGTTTGSITWSWTASTGPVARYRIYVGAVTNGQYAYFDTPDNTNSYIQDAPYVSGQFASPYDFLTRTMFIGEVSLPITSTSTTAATVDVEYPLNIALPPGYRIVVGISSSAALTGGWYVTAIGGKY